MNLTLKRPRGTDAPLVVGLPQVNLLPPEVRAAHAFSSVRRWLILAVVLALLLSLGFAVLATLQVSTARKALEGEQARTQQLLAQQAEYAEVPKVLRTLREATEAREYAMRTEVLWADYVRAVTAVMPRDVSIEMLTVETHSPLFQLSDTGNPLVEKGVARLTFSTRSATIPDTSDWLDALETLPGFRDAFFSTHPITEKDGSVFYEVESTVELDSDVYSGRFAIEDGPTKPESSDEQGGDA